jgi:zinc protease
MKTANLRTGLLGSLACLALLLCPPLWAQTQRFTLSNGLTVIVKPDHRAPTAVHMLWVRVGSMDEVDGSSGVAHVLEHMMFKGTPSLGPGEFARRVAALGGSHNAFTTRDATAYYQQVPADQVLAVMQLEADRFAHNQWPDEEFRREIEVIKEERRQRIEESPRARMFEAYTAQVYQASPYRRPVIGWMNDIESLTPDEARAFHRQWYVPGNAAVVVAGDVDPQQALAWAEQAYGRIPARAVPERKPRVEPAQQGPRRMAYRARAEQGLLTLGWQAPRLAGPDATDPDSQDALALVLLASVLDGYEGARLGRALVQGREGPRLADSVDASFGLLGRGPQLFSMTAVPAPGVAVDTLAEALKAQLGRVAREGVTEAELQRVKTQWRAGEVYKLDAVTSQARELGGYWVNGWDMDANERLLQRLMAVTAAQVQSVAQRRFDDRQLNVGVLVPEGQQ